MPFKTKFRLLLVAAISLPILLMAANFFYYFNMNSENSELDFATEGFWANFFKLEILFVLLWFFVLYITFTVFRKDVLNPMQDINNRIYSMRKGISTYKDRSFRNGEIGDIANAFYEMAEDLTKTHKRVEDQTVELKHKNWELHEANSQLEASYGQLQAMIDQLNEAEDKYHSLVQNIPDMVFVIDREGIISFANRACVEVLGYQRSELVGGNLLKFIDVTKWEKTFGNITQELVIANSITMEIPIITKDLTGLIAEVKFSNCVFNGMNIGLQAIMRDVTRQRQMERDIIESNNKLEILNSISKSMTSTLNLDELLSLIVDEITARLNFPACTLALIDKDGMSLKTRAYSGEFFRDVAAVSDFKVLSIEDKIFLRMFHEEKVLGEDDLPKEWIIGKINSLKDEKDRIKEWTFIPVNLKNRVIGTLSIYSNSKITEKDIDMLSSIANNAAIAIENALLYETSKKYFVKTIDALIAAVEAKDKYTEGHSQRVSKIAVKIAEYIGLTREQIEDIKIAGILHDIGKIGVRDNILLKAGNLTSDEYEEIKRHPSISNKILYPVGFSDRILKAIAFHHERFDGKGYPYGLKGNEICIEAQIIAVADAYDAMTSNRTYRNSMSKEDAIEELIANKATQFNPEIVDAIIKIKAA